ncbi:putative transcriptional regulator [Sulfurivirga caldicuralii]|uniref:UPF0301 protein SAMN05443662_0358 n=2 Tax=Sulfurivirga caldicuralii TaxID=364032 RepID=A0A1N6DR26_9GAMM|nr:putative transcriptional regulator [Sulfurivirga caldicuralii]
MRSMNHADSLAHHFLLAMPSLDGTYFERALIYVIEDTPEGSMGLVVNRPIQPSVRDMLDGLEIPILKDDPRLDTPVYEGGPVDPEHGFVIHRPQGNWKSSILMPDNVAMTVSLDLLRAMGEGQFPDQFIMALGYTGWEAGQLQQELSENSWLTLPYSATLMFDIPDDAKWEMALSTLGVSPEFLSTEAGHA